MASKKCLQLPALYVIRHHLSQSPLQTWRLHNTALCAPNSNPCAFPSFVQTRSLLSTVSKLRQSDFKETFLCGMCASHKRQILNRHMSLSVLSKVAQSIDMEALKQEIKKESAEKGEPIHLAVRIKELVAERAAEILANLTQEENKQLQVIQLEHNFLFSEGYDIPSPEEMTDELWVEALSLSSKSKRLKLYVYWKKRMYQKEADKAKREAKKLEMQDRPKADRYEHGHIFMRIYESAMVKWLNYQLVSAVEHGIPLVFDMDYADMMRPQEQKNTANQLHTVYCVNRADSTRDPFHLYFANCSPTNPVFQFMQYKTLDSQFFLSTVTEDSYLDLFEKDRLVYLSPHARQVMREFDPQAVYIVGAFNDKAIQKPVSYARAVEQGIKCQRLPIDEHLRWNQGNKNLTLDQMLRILQDVKNKLPWKTAFRAIPQRKLR